MEHTVQLAASAAALAIALCGCGASGEASATPMLRPALEASASLPSSAATAPASAPADAEGAEFLQEGSASYYADKFHGRKTASGERYDKAAFTCAHRRLPFGTMLKVEHAKTGKSVVVRVNDRGPFGKGVIDLSRAAAEELGIIAAGRAKVRVSVLPTTD
jgi:rare lipoprotein A